MQVNLGHYFALNHGYILKSLSGPFMLSLTLTDCVSVRPRIANILRWISVKAWHLVLLRIKRPVRFPAAELQNIHNEPHRRVCKEELHHTFHGSIVPAVIRVKTTAPPQKKTGEGSVLTLGFKSEKNIAKTWSTEKKSKEWLWVLTPDAISCQMKHPD